MDKIQKPVLGMILKGYPRISETFISNEILLLERLGFLIRLFSMRQPREPFCHDSVRQIRAAVDYLPETLLRPLPRLLYHNGLLAGQIPRLYLRAMRLAWRRFRRTRKLATVKHLLQAGYLVHRLLPQSGVTHLHAHFAHSPTSVALYASLLSGLGFSFTAHAKDIYTSDPRQLAEKMQMARFVVTCTEYNKHYLQGLLPDSAAPVYRVYHGIDLELFASQMPHKSIDTPMAPAPPFQIVTVARLTAKKGLPVVIKAIRRLCDLNVPVQYTLIGDGEDREKILSLIREENIGHVTRWLGTMPHHEVLKHYRRADLFVLGCETAPNGDIDGIPNVFMESMAMGVPVVATRISAIPELIEHERTGLLVPPGNPEQLAEAMIRLLTDIPLRQRIIRLAGENVQQHFDNRKLIQQLAGIYRKEGVVSFPNSPESGKILQSDPAQKIYNYAF
ncbi:MAG: glycosyltransferase family 4 protein [Desulfobacterales bacterium]|nr:glycosyltransferase family 4 protein [Desulfobacterales bacterium]MDD4072983.1 glycosyltransferase family 4 protein [Desulfobacterales bacterium]MDD4392865.1 glycosyltransferase family 4 protein [Desulfobacterales bacterium]